MKNKIYKKNNTYIYALGGLNEIGKNMYCIEHKNEIIIIDCGIMFPQENLLGIECIIQDYNYLIENQKKIKSLFISHGHEDHIGGISFLLEKINIPNIYATYFTKTLIEKKIKEKKNNLKYNIIKINSHSKIKTKYFKINFFNVTHSFPESLGIAIESPNGQIVYSGDFKFDFTPIGTNSDYKKINEISKKKVDLLLSDSTNSEVKGLSLSEKKVTNEIQRIFSKTKGRIIIASFASAVYRIQQIIEAAIKTKRKIAIFGRSMENVVNIAKKLKYIKVKNKHFLNTTNIKKNKIKKICIICTGSQGEPLSVLSRIAKNTHKQINIISGDTVIFSSNPIPGNITSVTNVINKLTRLGAEVISNSPLNSLHTTGHATKSEQQLMLQLIKPKNFMPVHGEYKMLIAHKNSAIETGINKKNIFICSNGEVLCLQNKKVYKNGIFLKTKNIYIDKKRIGSLSIKNLNERNILASNGFIAIAISINSKTNKILCKPNIVTRGFVYIKENQLLIKEAEQIVYKIFQSRINIKNTFNEIKKIINNALKPFLYRYTKRKPLIIPMILYTKKIPKK